MGTKGANVTEVPRGGDVEKVGIKLNLDVPASHFSHLGAKGNSVAGRLRQGGGRARGRAAVFTEGLLCGGL